MSTYINRSKWPKKLLVEGNDDLHVIANIRESYQLLDNFEIIDCKSVSNIKPSLLSYLKTKVDIIGVVVDADADTENVDDALKARWDSLRDALVAQDYVVPENPAPEGTIIPGTVRKPKIGIWLMPDNIQKPGMLEHFVATLIPPDDQLKPIAEEILTKIETDRLNKYKTIHSSKALIHTWLAWQEEPGTPMGLSITKTYLKHNSELCQRFIVWLDALFNTQ
ncbi:DUF3226 domain-containing protein [Spirosoma jeollabukense]